MLIVHRLALQKLKDLRYSRRIKRSLEDKVVYRLSRMYAVGSSSANGAANTTVSMPIQCMYPSSSTIPYLPRDARSASVPLQSQQNICHSCRVTGRLLPPHYSISSRQGLSISRLSTSPEIVAGLEKERTDIWHC
jgi:hypothetical protein